MMTAALDADAQCNIPAAEVPNYIKTFDDFNICAIKLENSYNAAHTAAEELIAIIDEFCS